MLRLIPLCGTQPRSNRNAVAAFSPVLADAVGLRWVTIKNQNNSEGLVAVGRIKSGGERAAVQTLREVCGRWAIATAFGVRWL